MGFVFDPSRVDGCEVCGYSLATFLSVRTLSSSLGVRQLGGAPEAAVAAGLLNRFTGSPSVHFSVCNLRMLISWSQSVKMSRERVKE